MQSMPEKTVSTKDIYTGKVITVKVSTVEIKDQKYSQREIVTHPGGACVVAINESKKIILVRQFRKPIENYTIELPAGKLESNEDPKNCIKRELHEETGYISHDIKFIQSFYTSPGSWLINQFHHLKVLLMSFLLKLIQRILVGF